MLAAWQLRGWGISGPGGRRNKSRPANFLAMAALVPLISLAAPTAQAMYISLGDLTTPETIGDGLHDSEFSTLDSSWLPDANTADFLPANPSLIAGPGGATWSLMGAGFGDVTINALDSSDHSGSTLAISTLEGSLGSQTVAGIVGAALDTWAAVSLFTNLGQVADGNVGVGATEASGGHLGDIRVAAWDFNASNILAHTFQPGTEAIFDDGTIAGDVHINSTAITWVDNASAGAFEFDLLTAMLHETGHALGLGHSDDSLSVVVC